VINEIWGDDALRDGFQVWIYLYPTGLGIPFNAWMLRKELLEMRAELDPEDDDPAMQDMVVVGHSMGGVLTKTLVSDSGDNLWGKLAKRPIEELVVDEETRETLYGLTHFEPQPFVRRVVFVATPHRGAGLADNLVGALGSWLISLPKEMLDLAGRIARTNPGLMHNEGVVHTSIDDLSPESQALQAMAALPMREDLPFHSIMGNVTDQAPPDCDDGVVVWRSSHLDGARSELVVPYGHSVHQHPRAQLEIRRILAEHLRERATSTRDREGDR
jgi:hypothetical protein